MVRILTCHHFGGQKITKCEEALQLTVADDYIVVALEHQVAVYSSELPLDDFSYLGKAGFTFGATRETGDIGSNTIYFDRPTDTPDIVNPPVKHETEITFSHSFPTVDLIDSISYNRRGNYLLCLEKRESNLENSNNLKLLKNVRLYFNWDSITTGKPMRARIAGLVSPTGAEPDDDTLVMIEIPPPLPATQNNPAPNVLAVSSCNILGHLATLTDASTVNVYSYRLKDSKGRASKNQYPDFDLSYTIEVLSFSLEKARISFLADFVALWSPTQVSVFRLMKHLRSRNRTISNDSDRSGSGSGRRSTNSGNFTSALSPLPKAADEDLAICDKVIFDPKNESVKVHMNLITRANHKRKFPDTGAGIYEEIQEEISPQSKSRLVYSASSPNLLIEDLLRVFLGQDQQNNLVVQVGLYAVKIKDNLGGVSCIVGTSSQAFVYHLPVRREATVCRVVTYPLTAPLVSFAFDSMFFHALTETGLETYTSRSLYFPLKEFEGFQRYKNDCPFLNETPSLIGIRPFMGVRYMAANELLLCLLSSPVNSGVATGSSLEENLWTIYALQLPTVEMLYEDMSKAAILAKSTNPDTFITLTSELHLVLRTFMNTNPEMESHFIRRYQKTCRSIGIEHFKLGASLATEAARMSDGTDKYKKEVLADDSLDSGVTYLMMAGTDLRHIFEEDPNTFIKDKKMIKGVTRFINVAIPEYVESVANTLSPKLAAVVTDFLVTNSPESLVQLVIHVPILRESNSAKLIQILKKMAEGTNFKIEESIALLLTLVTMSGCDAITRSQVRDILSKCKQTELEDSFDLSWILDLRHATKPKISDLTVCLSTAQSTVPSHVICKALDQNDISVGQVMMAFSQGINLNSDMEVQQALTRTLTLILERFFTNKLTANSNNTLANAKPKLPFLNLSTLETKTNLENDLMSNKTTSAQPILLQFNEEETHALKALVRSYTSHIALRPPTPGPAPRRNSGGEKPKKQQEGKVDGKAARQKATTTVVAQPANVAPTTVIDAGQPPSSGSDDPSAGARGPNGKELLNKNLSEGKLCPFGKVPNFLIHIIKDTQSHINTSLSALQVLTMLPMVNEETRESFIKLSSLLASPLGNTSGIREIVLNFLETKGLAGSALHVCLQMLAESSDKAIVTLIAKYPLALMYYAKEMFGRSTAKWKTLVSKLKEKIYLNSDDVEIYATIIESVYLYLANTLNPTELEEVLDKGEENSKFFKACRRTELANSYSQMILHMSNEYL